MKKLTRKIIIGFIFVLTTTASFGQTDNRFYNSIEDYVNDKPVDGYEIEPNSYGMAMGTEFVKVSSSEGLKNFKFSNLPYNLFKYDGRLYRVQKGRSYMVLASGAFCFYVMKLSQGSQYYSEGISSEILRWKEKLFLDYLEEYGLLDGFNSEKPVREFKESENEYYNRFVVRKIKYITLLNEKMKK